MSGSAPVLGLPDAANPWLNAFVRRVYARMSAGLVLAAASAWAVDRFGLPEATPVGGQSGMELTGWGVALVLSPLAIILVASLARTMSSRVAALTYWSVAGLIGASLGLLARAYTGAGLSITLLIVGAAFVGLSLWGVTTQRSLMGWAAFIETALVGLVLALLVNLVFRSSGAYVILNVLGILIFAGLVATDAKRLKSIYYAAAETGDLRAAENYAALTLYLNFINLFEFALSLTRPRQR